MFSYPAAVHVITGNLKVISDPRIRKKGSKSPKMLIYIDFNKC